MYSVSRKPATKVEYKEEKEQKPQILEDFFNWDLRSRGIFFFGDLSSIMRTAKQGTKKGFRLLRERRTGISFEDYF